MKRREKAMKEAAWKRQKMKWKEKWKKKSEGNKLAENERRKKIKYGKRISDNETQYQKRKHWK